MVTHQVKKPVKTDLDGLGIACYVAGVMKPEKKLPELEPGVQIKPVVGYEGLYSVTSDGRVWSIPRIIIRGEGIQQPIRGRWLRPAANPYGYLGVVSNKEGVRKTHAIHRLVARAFLGRRPQGFHTDHVDRDLANNSVDNLRYVTQSLNIHNTEVRGCCWDKDQKRWRAYLTVDRMLNYLGLFDSEEEAHAAYLAEKHRRGLLPS